MVHDNDDWTIVINPKKQKRLIQRKLEETQSRQIREQHEKDQLLIDQRQLEMIRIQEERREAWNLINQEREFAKSQQDQLEARMSAFNVVVSAYSELTNLPTERSMQFDFVLLRPIMHQFYTVTEIKIHKEKYLIRVQGPCCENNIEWTYEPHQVSMLISKKSKNSQTTETTKPQWHLCIQDSKLAHYFWSLWNDELPPFDEYVYQCCYYILAFYSGWKKDPYYFYGCHCIYSHTWHQISNSGNEITIDNRYAFPTQRDLLYSAIKWWQHHIYSKIKHQIQNDLLFVDLGKIIWSYYDDVDDYLKFDDVHIACSK